MLTPLDIHNKVFGRTFRGYRMDEVDAFLDEIIRDHEAFIAENRDLKAKVARMAEEAEKSNEISATLEKTMVLAQKVYEEEAQRAKKESEIILWEAEKNGEKLVQEAHKEALDIRQRIERLRLYEKQLYLKHKGFLEFQMELLDGYKDKETILSESEMEKLIHGARERDLLMEDDKGRSTLPDILSQGAAATDPMARESGGEADTGQPGDGGGDAETEVFVFLDENPGAGGMSPIPPEYRSANEKAGVTGGEGLPEETAEAAGKAAAEAAPAETVPADMAPVDMTPLETAPVDMAPAEKALAETAPMDMAPVETTPMETAPMDMTPEGKEASGGETGAAIGFGRENSFLSGPAADKPMGNQEAVLHMDGVPMAGIMMSTGAGREEKLPENASTAFQLANEMRKAEASGRPERVPAFGTMKTPEITLMNKTEPETAPVAGGDSPFVLKSQVKSMEEVVLLAQKMEEALKALDSIYGTEGTEG